MCFSLEVIFSRCSVILTAALFTAPTHLRCALWLGMRDIPLTASFPRLCSCTRPQQHANEIAALKAAFEKEKNALLAEIERLKALLVSQKKELEAQLAAAVAAGEKKLNDALANAQKEKADLVAAFEKEKAALMAKAAADLDSLRMQLMAQIKSLQDEIDRLTAELNRQRTAKVKYDQVRVDLQGALEMPIGRTVGRIQEIIDDLVKFQQEAEEDAKRQGITIVK